MTQAFIYIRFSTKAQDKGSSKDRQFDLCSSFCTQRGWQVVEVIEDLGRSAWKGQNLSSGELGKFAERVRAGDIPPDSVLIVEKLDRLSRGEIEDARQWMLEMTGTGLRIAVVDGGKVYDNNRLRTDLYDIMEQLMRADLANRESKQKSERVSAAWKIKQNKAKAEGTVLTASGPPWLRLTENRKWQVVEERATIVRNVYQWAADGIGCWSIAKRLNEERVPNWGKPRSTTTQPGWGHSYVGILIKNGAAEGEHRPSKMHPSGKRVPSGIVIEAYYPRIVDADLAARARSSMLGRQRTGGKEAHKARNLFTGLITCKACGGKINLQRRVENGRAYQYLFCDNAKRGRGCVHRGHYSYGKFEPAALDAVLHLALDDRFFQLNDQSVEFAVKLAETDKEWANRVAERDNTRGLLRRFPEDEQLVEDWQRLSVEVANLARIIHRTGDSGLAGIA